MEIGSGNKTNKSKKIISAAVVIVLIVICALLFGVIMGGNMFGSGKKVGKDIKIGDITELYYTYATSTFPPDYQRYYFYVKDGKTYFYHEKREGEAFPLTEEYITVSGTVELTEEQWAEFFGYLEGGSVTKRTESTTTGDSGPWLYLYWKNDKGKIQKFEFDSYGKLKEFEDFCISLKG